MRVKRFVGENVADTMNKIKQELGSEAIILQTRQFKEGGFFGFFGKSKVEITAAVDYERPQKKEPPKSPAPPQKENEDFQKELKNLHAMLEKMSKQINSLEIKQTKLPATLQKWSKALEGVGFPDSLIKKLLKGVQQNLNGEEQKDDTLVRQQLERTVQKLCSRTEAINPGVGSPKIIALIGPTGVGKTTTIGKLAAGFGIVDKRKVALITTDTFRVAAVEQLKTFGQIIGVPVEVAMTPTGLGEIVGKHTDKELIFIDTAGRSPQHQLHMQELKAFMDIAKPNYTMLVLSATTQAGDQKKVINEFKPLATHLIITKLDESISCGSVMNIVESTPLPVAYITNGQNVPNDIEVATPQTLSRYILGEVKLDG